ncbi:MAG: N-acetylmuramoyl-L-alanine amidase [Pseudomonadota bacterium]
MKFAPDTRLDCETRPAVNFGERASHLPIDILLLHYTGMETGEAAIDWLCCEESGVSCHYVVMEDGAIHQLVSEVNRAWHAGQSVWQGETDTNSRSIGIEIVNPGHEGGYPDFPEPQIASVIALAADIFERHDIPARNVLGHSDVAPGRKSDPGEKFPWRRLYESGVGHWVAEQTSSQAAPLQEGDNSEAVAALQALLGVYGYGCEANGQFDVLTRHCVEAFQLHFRQSRVDGRADAQTLATLESLLRSVPH